MSDALNYIRSINFRQNPADRKTNDEARAVNQVRNDALDVQGAVEQVSSTSNTDEPSGDSRDSTPPPLPPRLPGSGGLTPDGSGSLKVSKASLRPQLQSRPTTALSLRDVHTISQVESPARRPSPQRRSTSRSRSYSEAKRGSSFRRADLDDNTSIRSFRHLAARPGLDFDVESLAGETLLPHDGLGWKGTFLPFDDDITIENEDENYLRSKYQFENEFSNEFEELEELKSDASNEEELMIKWTSKLKHFLIFSSAGKPIYSRHGDDQLIANNIGVVQTIVSFFQNDEDSLRSFVAGDANFVISSKGHLHLVAISRLDENESQLRTQLDTLYMQILSTLTLPTMQRMFLNRPSLDLRRPLGNTEKLLSALSDGFTRGSPTSLLSSLECLRLQKSERDTINRTFVKTRSTDLLYGLVVAGGQLVSVLRPKKHSLHPSDLHLVFNMLFDSDSIRVDGGENWIPICLPGFNNAGFLYMYVSFLGATDEQADEQTPGAESTPYFEKSNAIAILLLSANKEAFFELQTMRDTFVNELKANGSLANIRTAVQRGRYSSSDVAPGALIRHFLYKSRANVQFTMPSLDPDFSTAIARRKLFSLYSSIHNAVHNRQGHLKVHFRTSRTYVALGWVGPLFEIYCVAGSNISRAALTQGVNKVMRWIQEEEEKLFIVGGAVF